MSSNATYNRTITVDLPDFASKAVGFTLLTVVRWAWAVRRLKMQARLTRQVAQQARRRLVSLWMQT